MHMNRRNGRGSLDVNPFRGRFRPRKIEYDSRDGIGEEVSRLPGTARATLSAG